MTYLQYTKTYWSPERKQNLSTNGMEVICWGGDVADKPVTVMKLLHGKVVAEFLQRLTRKTMSDGSWKMTYKIYFMYVD